MPILNWRTASSVVKQARLTLGQTQAEFGGQLRASTRTIIRWEQGRTEPGIEDLRQMATLVRGEDAALAAQLESIAQEQCNLAGWDPAQRGQQRLAPLKPSIAGILDAAMGAAQVPRPTMRLALRAALTQAKVLGLTVDALLEALDEPA
jgi:transcriptional regulator with XRE-family HTH domain